MNRNNKKLHRKLVNRRNSLIINKAIEHSKRIEKELIEERNKVLTNILMHQTLLNSEASHRVMNREADPETQKIINENYIVIGTHAIKQRFYYFG